MPEVGENVTEKEFESNKVADMKIIENDQSIESVEEAFEVLRRYFKECEMNNIPLNSGEPYYIEKWSEEFYS